MILRILPGFLALTAIAAPLSAEALGDADRAAIIALEQRTAALPGPGATSAAAPLAARMAEVSVPGVSIAFIENGRIKWARGYGVARVGGDRPVAPDTRFQAASLSKAVAAAGALRLVDQGRLALDSGIARRLRSWRIPAAPAGIGDTPITLRGLLSHTAGLSVSGYPGYPAAGAVATPVQSLAGATPSNTAAVRRFAAPGSFAYSGGGFTVAQVLMTDAAGSTFAPLMQRLVLAPAGMTASTFDPIGRVDPANAASGHDSTGAPIAGDAHVYPEQAAAGLWTTPSDYARFVIALQESWAGRPRALLRPATARAMMTPGAVPYGLGVQAINRDGRRAIAHGGSNEGFICRFTAFLDGSRQGVVIMTNGDGANGNRLAAAIHRTIALAYGWPDTSAPPLARAPQD